MAARMGMYKSGLTEHEPNSAILNHFGGYPQQDRMINDKYRSFLKALQYSYQGAFIKKVNEEEQFRALINPNKTKQDYDDKIISVDYKYNLKPGSVFNWANTGTYWLIYLQDLTELAYFRGDIRKCNYTISWKDDENIQTIYAAVRGPVETKINFIQKNGISIDTPNHSLNILMPKNNATIKYFKRYAKFYLQEDQSICWRVEAIDSISMPGVLEVTAVEYYENEFEDNNGIVGDLIVAPVPDDTIGAHIEGYTFIKPKVTYDYSCNDSTIGTWTILEKDRPIELIVNEDNSVSLKWTKTYSGQFTLQYGDYQKTIVVESLF